MENSLLIQIILLIIVLSLSFYLLFPLIMEMKREQKQQFNDNKTPAKKQEESDLPLAPTIISYADKANTLKEKEKRTEEVVNQENSRMANNNAMPKYEDDPSSIDLKDLAELRNAIRNMTRELSNVRKTNTDLRKIINELQRNHTDAINRVSNTDLWEQEQQKWSREFVMAYQDYTKQAS